MYIIGRIVPRKYMPMISAVGHFCCGEFEENPNKKVVNLSKLLNLTLVEFSYYKISKDTALSTFRL